MTFLSVSAVSIGFDDSVAFYLVAVANATSAIGRILGGAYAFVWGPINAIIVFTSVAAICTYIWPFVTTKAGFIVLTCFYGYVAPTSSIVNVRYSCGSPLQYLFWGVRRTLPIGPSDPWRLLACGQENRRADDLHGARYVLSPLSRPMMFFS